MCPRFPHGTIEWESLETWLLYLYLRPSSLQNGDVPRSVPRRTKRYTFKDTVSAYRFSITEGTKYGRFIYKEAMSILNCTTCDCQRNSPSVSTELEINFHRYILKTCCSQPVKHHHYELSEQAEGLLLSWECRQPKGKCVIGNTAGVCAPLKAIPGEFPMIHSNLCPRWKQSGLGQRTALAGKLNSQTNARFWPDSYHLFYG